MLTAKRVLQWRAAISVLSLGLALSGCGKGDASTAPNPGMALPVTAIEAKPQRLPLLTEAVGQAEGSQQIEVRARVSGILEKQLYKEGETVRAGQALFQIEPALYQATYDQAKAALEQARREVARLKPLVEHRAISQKEYDDAVTALQLADGRAREAELNLTYATVTAPIGGVTGRAVQSIGTLVSPTANTLLTTISHTDPIWVRFSFSEAEYAQLQHDPTKVQVKLVLADGSIYKESGHLNFAGSTVDTRLGTVQMRAEFSNPTLAILPGQFVRVQVLSGEQTAVLVPQAAVMQSDQGRFVWTVDKDSKTAPRPVEVANWQGQDWIVRKGLGAGDKVIVDNIIKLRPGVPVQAHPPGPPPGGAAAPATVGKNSAGAK